MYLHLNVGLTISKTKLIPSGNNPAIRTTIVLIDPCLLLMNFLKFALRYHFRFKQVFLYFSLLLVAKSVWPISAEERGY